jgi:hypothetical protein
MTMNFDPTSNDYWAILCLFVVSVSSWISWVLMLQPHTPLRDAVGGTQWAGLGFTLGISLLMWFRFITIRTISTDDNVSATRESSD